jgi:hypothetical protein
MGPDGQEVWIKDNRTGQPLRRVLQRIPDPNEPFVWDEFQLQDLGNGMVKKNRNFRAPEGQEYRENIPTPSQDEMARKIDELEHIIHGLIAGDTMAKAAVIQEADVPEPDEDDLDPEVAVPQFLRKKEEG